MTLQESEQHEAFRGEGRHKIDAKGRVSVPADFRKILEANDPDRTAGAAASLVVVYGLGTQKCLRGYSVGTANRRDQQILRRKMPAARKSALKHIFIQKSVTAQLDPNGRLLIPAALRAKAQLKDTAFFAGLGDHFEIWNPTLHEKVEAMKEAEYMKLVGQDAEWVDPSELLELDDN